MANSKSKLNLTTQNPLAIFLTTLIFLVLVINKVKSDSVSFNFPSFEASNKNIAVNSDTDANVNGGILQMTKKDQYGNPFPHSVGLAGFFGTVPLSNKTSGRIADFTTEFTFVVNPKGSQPHADGFTFFLASLDFVFPDNSSGGFLGLFNEVTALNTSLNKVVAVEFDSFANQWDPNFPVSDSPHIGININSIRSVATVPWPIDRQSQGAIGKARVTYESVSKLLSVSVTYQNTSAVESYATTLSYPIDFATVLSERAIIGFSAATGELVETHDILSWSLTFSL
ncbi:mannose/glucose-specific lectin-like [Abrus precatorius]|uniref:Mannose/glucose-specific lectin-like n=1 Tax=Abrus precatorius TaxID=3816 RepID=A0A8B8M1Y4_ABRPR|nr:mannose/glucose-specific lectin-like [Abrus precatorius]